MRVRPIAAAGVGVAAAVAFAAATTPALAASSSLLDVSGNQGAGIVGLFDNEAAPQLAGGQVLQAQGNADPDARLLTSGDVAGVTQNNKAEGNGLNAEALDQTVAQGGTGGDALVDAVGNQVAGIVGVYDNQVLPQLAAGQAGLVQGNLDTPVRVLAPGNDAAVQQSNGALGNAQSSGGASDPITQGGAGSSSLVGVVGNQVAGIVGVDDNQLAGQGAIGQVGLPQVNANAPMRLLSPGTTGSTTQSNFAEGNACAAGAADQAIDPQGGGQSLLGVTGNQGAGVVGVGGNQAQGQGAVGQGGTAQGNLNLPVNVLSPGDTGAASQTNESYGTATTTGSASQDVTQ